MLGCLTFRRSTISTAFALVTASLFFSSVAVAVPSSGRAVVMATQKNVKARISCWLPDSSRIEKTVDVTPQDSTPVIIDLRVTDQENISLMVGCYANRGIRSCSSTIFQTIDERTVQSNAVNYLPSRGPGLVRFAQGVVQKRERRFGKNGTISESLETYCEISLRSR
jgi:hypothetical protein